MKGKKKKTNRSRTKQVRVGVGLGVPKPPHKPESKGFPQEMRVSEKGSDECCLPSFRFWKAEPETRVLRQDDFGGLLSGKHPGSVRGAALERGRLWAEVRGQLSLASA